LTCFEDYVSEDPGKDGQPSTPIGGWPEEMHK